VFLVLVKAGANTTAIIATIDSQQIRSTEDGFMANAWSRYARIEVVWLLK